MKRCRRHKILKTDSSAAKKDKHINKVEVIEDLDSDIKLTSKNLFNFKYIGISLIFLTDFNINNIDFLPDFIAVILISAGIGRIWFINENFNAVKKYAKIFYAVALSKLAFNILYFIFSDHPVFTDGVVSVNVIFVIELLEMILCILIFGKIFKGIEDYLYASESNLKPETLALIIKILNIFFAVKFLLNLIPHVPVLLSASDFDALSVLFETWIDGSFLTKFLLPPCVIIQTLFGLFTLSVVFPFITEASKDNELCGLIKKKINDFLINDIFFVFKLTYKTAFSFFAAGCIFFIDLQFDNINILPDFMICILLIIGISLVKSTDLDIKNKKLDLYLIINFFVSAVSYIMGTIYKTTASRSFSDDMISAAGTTIDINVLRIVSNVFYHSSVIIFLLIFIEFYFFIKNMQKKHLDFSTAYLSKYHISSDKNIYKNRDIIFIIAAAVFSVKTLSVLLPQDLSAGLIIFIHSLVLIIFVVFLIRGLYMTRDNIYSYYS